MDTILRLLEFPSSLLLALLFQLALFALWRYATGSLLVRWLSHRRSGVVLLALGAEALAIEGTLSLPIHRSLFFAIYALVLIASLTMAVLSGLHRKARPTFMLSHAGMLLIVWAALFGAPDVRKVKMVVPREQPENVGYREDGTMLMLPFAVQLQDFRIDYYADGTSPKQYTSTLLVDGEEMQTSVNHPCMHEGYAFFQESYDRKAGRYSVLQLVRDPWLPVVYIGMALLAMGAVLMLFGRWRAKVTVPVTVVLTIVFTYVTVMKINFGTLMPALRSWWFVPHLFFYMVAYSLMAMALVCFLIQRLRHTNSAVPEMLVRSSSALLIIGMLTGSVWARQAWGDYWAWDAKENWAAVTWFVSLIYLHLSSRRSALALSILILAFLALQITWYGVNYLPSAANSLHTYTG